MDAEWGKIDRRPRPDMRDGAPRKPASALRRRGWGSTIAEGVVELHSSGASVPSSEGAGGRECPCAGLYLAQWPRLLYA
jgi:hypothetical protein